MELMTVFAIWVLLCVGVALLADSRGRSFWGFFLLSFVFSPLLGLIVILVMKNLTEEAGKEAARRQDEERRELEQKREHEKQLESLRALATFQAGHSVSKPAEPITAPTLADELTKLAALRDKGVLSSEEFEQQKKHLLKRT